MPAQRPQFFSPLRILTFALVSFLTIHIGYFGYNQGNPIIFTYTHVYYAFGAFILLFGVLKCLFHLARVELKSLLYTALATSIYLGVVFMGNFVCDKIKEYHGSEHAKAKVYQKRLQGMNDMIAVYPNNDMLFLQRGRFYKSHHRNEKAVQDFKTTLDINAQNNQALIEMANYYKELQDHEKELEMLERAFTNTSNKSVKSRIDKIKGQNDTTENE